MADNSSILSSNEQVNLPAVKDGKIGPNSIIQLRAAVIDVLGEQDALQLFSNAGYASLYHDLPTAMIDEAIPQKLFQTLFKEQTNRVARRISIRAGELTADYIIANRIPAPVVLLLKLLPPQISGSLLMKAINRHAWTFCGSGSFSCKTAPVPCLSIRDNPLRMPDSVWHHAVFQRLFSRLVCSESKVTHMSLQAGKHDHFVICYGMPVFGHYCDKHRKEKTRAFCFNCTARTL